MSKTTAEVAIAQYATGCILLTITTMAIAQFHDQGLKKAVIRTEFNSQTEGLPGNPVTYASPCLFTDWLCGTGPTDEFDAYPFFQNTSSWPQANYWVLNLNNEPAYDKVCPAFPRPGLNCIPGQIHDTTSNPGAPNLSLPRSSPGFGLMGFTALIDTPAGENFYRAHLVLNEISYSNPDQFGIPYMSIAGVHNRGNSSAVGIMNDPYPFAIHKVRFKAKLWDFVLPNPASTQDPALFSFVTFRSNWGGKNRGVFILLSHWLYEVSTPTTISKYQWNWPIVESAYHPGVEYVYFDAEDVRTLCGTTLPTVPLLTTKGQEISYVIDIEKIFRCASDLLGYDTPMPTSGVLPIESVEWGVEMAGNNGAIWMSVHDMKMTN